MFSIGTEVYISRLWRRQGKMTPKNMIVAAAATIITITILSVDTFRQQASLGASPQHSHSHQKVLVKHWSRVQQFGLGLDIIQGIPLHE